MSAEPGAKPSRLENARNFRTALWLSAQGEHELASKLVEVIERLSRPSPVWAYARAVCHEGQGATPSAIQVMAAAVQQWPDSLRCWSYLGLLRYQVEDFAGAIVAIRRAAEIKPNADMLTILSWAYLRSEPPRIDEAVETANEALALRPGWDEAQACLERASEMRSD